MVVGAKRNTPSTPGVPSEPLAKVIRVDQCPLPGGGIPAFATVSPADTKHPTVLPQETLVPPEPIKLPSPPDGPDVTHMPNEAAPAEVDKYHNIQIFKRDSLQPLTTKVHKNATIGSIIMAEHRLGTLSEDPEHYKPVDAVGMLLPPGDTTAHATDLPAAH